MTEYEALEQMDRKDARGVPIPFPITWVTLDVNRRTGGKVRHMEAAVRCGAKHSLNRHKQVAIKPADGSGHPIPVHISLITRVNNQPVMR